MSEIVVSADEIDFVAALRAPHCDERRRMLQVIVKEPRCLSGQVDASAAVGTRDYSRAVDRAILARGIVGNGVESCMSDAGGRCGAMRHVRLTFCDGA